MYISKVRLENIRRFESACIELPRPGMSILICGNNGSGKTALLRSIAMGLCDQVSSGALLRDLQGDIIRKTSERNIGRGKRERTAEILIDIQTVNRRSKFQMKTTLDTRSDIAFETVTSTILDNKGDEIKTYDFKHWADIFAVGYGAGLRTNGTEDYVQYFTPDAVYNLFEYTYPLHNAEISWRRIRSVPNSRGIDGRIRSALKKLLSLADDANVILDVNGIFIEDSKGRYELEALGDGHKALVILVLDILAWKLLSENNAQVLKSYETGTTPQWKPLSKFKDLTGIVIIDEIEKHLHPKLQHNIIPQLKSIFPRIQFIITTHSPLCVSGAADVERNICIYRTEKQPDGATELVKMPAPTGLTADQIFQEYFEMGDTRNQVTQDLFYKYNDLYLKEEKNTSDKTELRRLEKILSSTTRSFDEQQRNSISLNVNNKLDEILKSLDRE